MKPDDSWTPWRDTWQRQQSAVDAVELQRQVQRKLQQMRRTVRLRLAGAMVSAGLLVWLGFLARTHPGMQAWVAVLGVLLLAATYSRFRVSRGAWQASSESVADLLRLTDKRTHAGIRLAGVNIIATIAVALACLWFLTPWFAPLRWSVIPELGGVWRPLAAAIGAVTIISLAFNAVYLRRQRMQLRNLRKLLQPDTTRQGGQARNQRV